MSDEVDFVICGNCETPCYAFETDENGKVTDALCPVCGNDEAKDFTVPEEDEEEEG